MRRSPQKTKRARGTCIKSSNVLGSIASQSALQEMSGLRGRGMTKFVRHVWFILAIGVGLMTSAWIANMVAFNLVPLRDNAATFVLLLIGLAYWTFSLPGMVLFSLVSSRMAFTSMPGILVPPPLLASEAMFGGKQFAGSM